MKVVQILPELNEGGVERGVVEINREFVKRGIVSVVVSNGGKMSSNIVKDGGEFYEFDVASKNLLNAPFRAKKLKNLLNNLTPDIVHIRSRVPAWLVNLAKPKAKIISTIHGLNSVNFYSKIMTKADALIVPSNYSKEYVITNFSAPKDLITVIPRGVDLASFNPINLPSKIKLRNDRNLPNDSFIISCVGRITNLKNIEILLKATPFLKNALQNVKILIVGGVHEKRQGYFESLKELIKAQNIQNEVIFTGSVKNVAEIYKLSDAVVSPSLKPESFGRSVAEAIAMNTPVVASNHGGVKDIILDGINGYFFNPSNAKELVDKLLLAQQLKFDGYEYIKTNFNLNQMVEKTIKVYENALNKS
ncbi:MAG: glycosyltransferase family 4 protein [Campylobacter sp.]|nr:glycosyltransferase family 4 protein [Campylobacter sp.]